MGFLDFLLPRCSKCGATSAEQPIGWFSFGKGQERVLLCQRCVNKIFRRGQIERKSQELRKEIGKAPQNAENYYNLSELLVPDEYHKENYESSDIEECCELLSKSLAIGLSDPLQRGRAYFKLAVLKEEALFLHPRDPSEIVINVHSSLGKQYLKSAEKEFKLALSYDPDNIHILEQLEVIYRGLKKDEERGEILACLEEAKTKKSMGLPLTSRKSRLSSSQKGLTFEHKCMEVIQSMGFSTQSTKIVADGGIDIIAFSNQPLTRGRYIIQCKNWRKPVGAPIVRDLYGVVASDNAVKGILISSSGFTSSAINFAKDIRLELIDGHQLDYLSSLVTKKE